MTTPDPVFPVLRPASVAGSFYPAQPGALDSAIASLLDEADTQPAPAHPPKALIVPHAGYLYSGPIAARAYVCLAALRSIIRKVVLLGPAHRVALHGLALPEASAFVTPLGHIPLDAELAAKALELPQVHRNAAAHALEHSLEVQLPFLQHLLDDFTLLPLLAGQGSTQAVATVLNHVWGGAETLILISSDLSHYLPYAQARQLDQHTATQITALQPLDSHEQACGATPINGLLLCARQRGLQARLLDLRNSGDTAGDQSRVVGYAAFTFTEPAT
ncbi:MAG: AmmeMemoRadiSam system protein B [Sterolibacterium sp.]|nr:AmmeMemoRadiSam system protein B [Sterolibacterium sp.]